MKVLVLFGTRPEAIKLAPLVRALSEKSTEFATRVCSTGQHREMTQQVVDAFKLRVDVHLDAMVAGVSLGALTARMFADLDGLLTTEMPDCVVVQGDTTTAMVGAMSAFYMKTPICHVEAGLRTHDRWSPFPEEVNRSIISCIADLHFAPTSGAAENLKLSGVPESTIFVCGNTVIDALIWTRDNLIGRVPAEMEEVAKFIKGKRLILATSHRRESFGPGLESICSALLAATDLYQDAVVVFPVHLNPRVQGPVRALLGGQKKVKLIEPVGYPALVWLMDQSYCILTDSGGIQEEAPSLGKPVLILRDSTERGEVIAEGCARLVGSDPVMILKGVRDLFEDSSVYRSMSQARNPFGDGSAAGRIVAIMEAELPRLVKRVPRTS